MSYDIYIGQATIDVPSAEDLEEGYNALECRVNGMQLDDAPAFPGDLMTGKGNSRHPGYGSFSEFLKTAGLHDLFFNKETGLMRSHPGCFMLAKHHAEAIHEALERWRRDHPKAEPGWCDCPACDRIPNSRPVAPHMELDGILARLIWFDFWVRWTMANCTIPAICNR
jgi:hypothetical protein